jgi:hypothetical protein
MTMMRHTTDEVVFADEQLETVKHRDDGTPWWQVRPCPTWCENNVDDTSHSSDLDPDDRVCHSRIEQRMQLQLHEVQSWEEGGRVHYSPSFLDVYLRQEFREVEPRLVFTVNEMAACLELTVSEARSLHARLEALVEAAEHGHGGA